MSRIYQIASEHTNFLNKKGYNNRDLNFKGMPDTTFTEIFSSVSEGIIKTWPENKSFEFTINNAGKYDQLQGIAYFKFNYAYNPEKLNLSLISMNIQLHAKSIDLKLNSPKDLPHSCEIPDLIKNPILIYRKYNIKSKTILGHYSKSVKL